MSSEASAAEEEGAFAEIHQALQRMRRSSRASVPMVLLGLAMTLAAAAVAIYYVVTLRNSNADLAAALEDSRAALVQTQQAHARAIPLLMRAKAGGPAATGLIDQALRELHRGVDTLASAERGLETAEASMTTEGIGAAPDAPAPSDQPQNAVVPGAATAEAAPARVPERILPPPIAGRFFSVLASFDGNEAGLAEAVARAEALQQRGLCVEIWMANVSGHYAVVFGGVTNEEVARARTRQARADGIAADAFTQFDRGWNQVENRFSCAEAAAS